MESLTLEGAIKYIKEVVQKNRRNKEKNTIIIPNSFISSTDCAEKYEQVVKWLEELKSYKDIGTLKELKELKENGAFTDVELAQIVTMQNELKKYKDLEEQGLLVKLPCKVGDTVYVLTMDLVSEFKITAIFLDIHGTYFYWLFYYCGIYERTSGFSECDIGKTVFLTREEAEEKLEEMKNERI